MFHKLIWSERRESWSAAKLGLYWPEKYNQPGLNQNRVTFCLQHLILTGTYFILYDFLDHFKKDNRIFLQRSAFLDIINTIFGDQWPVSQLEKEAIILQVK